MCKFDLLNSIRVDSIIKETLKKLLSKFKHSKDAISEICYRHLERNIKNPNNKFVFKLSCYEEYMFGEYPICTYETIRKYVREFEPVNVILMNIKKSVANPSIHHFPPMIYIPAETDISYNILLKKYIQMYPKESIIFRFKSNIRCIENELTYDVEAVQSRESRFNKLIKYTESSECDFPLEVKVKGINNFFALKKHMDEPSYHENEILLPNFIQIPSNKEILERKNIFEVIFNCNLRKYL